MLMVVPFEYERFHSRSFILQHLLTYNDGLENRIKQKKEEERNEQTKEKSSFYVQVFVASPFFFYSFEVSTTNVTRYSKACVRIYTLLTEQLYIYVGKIMDK